MSQLLVESVALDGCGLERSLLLDDRDPFFPSQDSGSLLSTALAGSDPIATVDPPQDKPTRLGDFFAIVKEPRPRYSDWEIREISRHLEENKRQAWSQAPRLYTVLRIIGQLQFLDDILNQGISDIWFPFKEVAVPAVMSPSMRNRFLEVQSLVLTKAVDLEKSEKKQHAHFGRGDLFPFEVRERLGRGGHGAVDKIFSPFSRREFARKQFKRGRGPMQRGEVRKFQTELQTLKKIQHHHCIELIASYTDTKYFGLIMSPVADCTLTKYYALAEEDLAKRKTMRKFFGCLASGLCYLHDIKIRHRDIKPENILVRGSEVLLSDFGISLDWEHLSRSTTTEDAGKTWMYCAPEVAHYQPRNKSSDIWSLGCVFLEMSTVLKLESLDTMQLLFRDRSDSCRFYQNLAGIQAWLRELAHRSEDDSGPLDWITLMLQNDPNSRPTAGELLTAINNAAFRKEGEMIVYCGECCANGADSDSTAESASDDDLWAEKLVEEGDEDEATPPQLTDNAAKAAESRGFFCSRDAFVKAVTPPARPIAEEPSTEIRHEARGNALGNTPSIIPPLEEIDLSSNHKALKENIGEAEASGDGTVSPRPSKPTTALPPILNAHVWASPKVASNMEEVGLYGNLPKLTIKSWHTPSHLLGAIRQDRKFMAHLQSQVPKAYGFIELATIKDIASLVQLLVCNGLNVYSSDSTKTPPPILQIMDWDEEEREASFLVMICAKAAAGHLTSFQRPVWVRAASLDHVGAMRALIKAGAGPDAWTETTANALLAAAKNNQAEAVQFLVENVKVHPDLPGFMFPNIVAEMGGLAPLSWAASKGHVEVVRVLLADGASLYPSNSLDPITMAAENGHLEVVQHLVETGKPLCYGSHGRRFLKVALHAASAGGHASIVQYLLESRAVEVDRRSRYKRETPLCAALTLGQTEVVRTLLEHGANPNRLFEPSSVRGFSGKEQIYPMHVAVAKRHVDIVKLLLERGADVSVWTSPLSRGDTAVDIARRRGYAEIVMLLEQVRK